MSQLDVDVVMVPRERYEPTVESLRGVLATVPADVRVILVRGGMSRRMLDRVRRLDSARVEVVGPSRHLAPNASRAVGLRRASARYVAFVDNDIDPERGWLEALVRAADDEDAWVVRPLVLQRVGDDVTIHEAGGDCHLERQESVTTFVESHRMLGESVTAGATLVREPVELFEFHTALFDRERLVDLGGPDERMLSQADHLDLALRVHDAGGTIWLEPASRVTYTIPGSVALRDLPFFLGRWSRSWNQASRRAFSTTHGVDDPDDPCETWGYPEMHRSYGWLPVGRLLATVARRGTASSMARRFDAIIGRHVAELALRTAPGWRGRGLEAGR